MSIVYCFLAINHLLKVLQFLGHVTEKTCSDVDLNTH